MAKACDEIYTDKVEGSMHSIIETIYNLSSLEKKDYGLALIRLGALLVKQYDGVEENNSTIH